MSCSTHIYIPHNRGNRNGVVAVGLDFVDDGQFGGIANREVCIFLKRVESENFMGELDHELFKL